MARTGLGGGRRGAKSVAPDLSAKFLAFWKKCPGIVNGMLKKGKQKKSTRIELVLYYTKY